MSTNPNTEENRTFTLQELEEAYKVGHHNAYLHIFDSFETWVRKAHNLQLPKYEHGIT